MRALAPFKSWDVDTRRELYHRMNVVLNDRQLNHSGAVTASDPGQHSTEKRRRLGVD